MSADLASHAPLLPTAGAMQLWLHLGWSVVLAWLAAWWVPRRPWTAALLAALWAWAPGAYSPAYWLGLAFQAPSVVTVLLCAGGLWPRWRAGDTEQNALTPRLPTDRRVLALAVLGALTGWVLLLDTFALLPLPIYAWGFGPLAVGLIAMLATLPWVVGPRGDSAQGWRLVVVPLAVLVLVVWRLPSGNAWDAVLDPGLWLILQLQLAQHFWKRYKKSS